MHACIVAVGSEMLTPFRVDTNSLLITDIAMGRSTDRVPTYYERMFLPQFLVLWECRSKRSSPNSCLYPDAEQRSNQSWQQQSASPAIPHARAVTPLLPHAA